MANEYLVNKADLELVAESIRNKTGTTDKLVFPLGFKTAVESKGGTFISITDNTSYERKYVTVSYTINDIYYSKVNDVISIIKTSITNIIFPNCKCFLFV